jgi:Ca2+-binding EF-hand superfamily protein
MRSDFLLKRHFPALVSPPNVQVQESWKEQWQADDKINFQEQQQRQPRIIAGYIEKPARRKKKKKASKNSSNTNIHEEGLSFSSTMGSGVFNDGSSSIGFGNSLDGSNESIGMNESSIGMNTMLTAGSTASQLSYYSKSVLDNGEIPDHIGHLRKALIKKKKRGRKLLPKANSTSIGMKATADDDMERQMTKFETKLDSAQNKINKHAKVYDRYRDGPNLQQGFLEFSFTPIEFQARMRKILNIKLTTSECNALVQAHDRNNDGTIDGAEFLLMFFKAAHEAKSADAHERHERARIESEIKVRVQKEEEEAKEAAENDFMASTNWTPADQSNILKKLAKISSSYDVTSDHGKLTSHNFSCVLRPLQLQTQIFKSFNLKIKKKELVALVDHFDSDGDGSVSGAEFLAAFTKLGAVWRRIQNKRRDQARIRKRARGFCLPYIGPGPLGR